MTLEQRIGGASPLFNSHCSIFWVDLWLASTEVVLACDCEHYNSRMRNMNNESLMQSTTLNYLVSYTTEVFEFCVSSMMHFLCIRLCHHGLSMCSC